MHRLFIAAILALAPAAGSALGQQADAEALIAQYTADADSPLRTPAELTAAFDAILDFLLPGMAAEELAAREKPQQTLERLCHRAGRPGADAERDALCRAIAKRLGGQTARPARVWMIRKLEPLGADECVAALAACLTEVDVEVSDAARRALQHNPSPAARDALLAALGAAGDAASRVGLINALAARRDATLLPTFTKYFTSDDDATAIAAMTAMGDLESPVALHRLIAVWMNSPPPRRRAAGAAISRIAERLIADGQLEDAASVYTTVFQTSPLPHVKAAALIGLARAQGDAAMPLLRATYLASDVPGLRPIAARIAGEVPGPGATGALAEDLPKAAPDIQVVILDVLADRGDAALRAPARELYATADETVRVAILDALSRVGDASDALTVAEWTVAAEGGVQKAARSAMARFRASIDDALIQKLGPGPSAALRAECIRALAARLCRTATPALLVAAEDAEADVRAAALDALGELAGPTDVPQCIRALMRSAPDVRSKAEDMLAAVCLRMPDKESRVQPLLDELRNGDPANHASLIRVLARLEGTSALAAVRQAAEDGPNAEIRDAGIRALAGWSSVEVLPDLERVIADAASQPIHRTLAVRGLTRLVRSAVDRGPEQRFELLERTWSQCDQPDDRKLILAAIADLKIPAALSRAMFHLNDDALRNEAAAATIALARALAATHRSEASDAIQAVMASSVDEKQKTAAAEAREWIAAFEGYIREWQYCGPYTCKGKNSGTLFDVAFPPEPSCPELPADATGPAAPDWKPLTAFKPDNPWIADFTQLDKGVSRCVYVRTTIVSDVEQSARLEVGSDDGVEVWLNGQSVHRKVGIRSVKPGEDQVPVVLRSGANELLLKVSQGDGGWGVCCGVRSSGGEPLIGVSFRAP